MKDRIATYPGRIRLLPVSGHSTNTYTLQRADEAIEEGTPINKATLLTDETADFIWDGNAPEDPTVNDALYHLREITQTDTGWVDLGLNSAVSQRTADIGEYNGCAYRIVGNQVHVAFSVSWTASSNYVRVNNTSLPADIRPSASLYAWCVVESASDMRIARIRITTSGNITIQEVYTLGGTKVTSGNIGWCDAKISWFVGE